MPLLLFVILAGLTLLKYFESGAARSDSGGSPVASGELRIDSHALLDHIINALGVVDQAVALAAPRTPVRPGETDLAHLHDIVDFLHQLTGPALRGNAQRLLEVAEPVQQLLARHGLRIDVFSPQEAGDQAKWIVQPARDPDAHEYVMLTPALVAEDGRVIRPGRVCLPAEASAQ